MKIKRLLVANRGEIAIRIFRACTELNIETIAIYSNEDRYSLHRYKADEAYLIGKGLDPIAAYLNIDEIIELALNKDIDAIHPGYGFLSESSEFAKACNNVGIIFVGPSYKTLKTFGDKHISRMLAAKCNIPIIEGSDKEVKNIVEAKNIAKNIGYPLLIKATAGGGGRGIRICNSEDELIMNFESAKNESLKSFGREGIILEKYIEKPKHIEVQLLADNYGNIIHLYERDCSIQRRHQKIIEMAPSLNINKELLNKLYNSSIILARKAGLVNAATVEYLVDNKYNYYFLEVNPRIQVEHTVTEEITGIDIVQSQILIAEGKKLDSKEINIKSQQSVQKDGHAIQCRVTTEDPENNFIPDTGQIQAYRTASGFGVRLDAGSGFINAKITPHYDSLLVKVTTWGRNLEAAARKMNRSLSEFRIRGVKTNIPFLKNVIQHPTFLRGDANTTFIDNTPNLFKFKQIKDRATKALMFLGNNIINNPSRVYISDETTLPTITTPIIRHGDKVPEGTKNILENKGVKGIIEYINNSKEVLFTSTTFRDAHQSLLATRLRTIDLLNIADIYSHYMSELFSIEMWGGATFDVSYRFLKESPWERLKLLREKIPNIMFQMLLRASNAVGYTNYPDNVVKEFIRLSSKNGIDIFRIFDCFNWVEQMRPAIDEVKKQGKVCEAAICYTGDITDSSKNKYNLKYYVDLSKELAHAGTDIIGIKDMAGLCKPYAAKMLIKHIKEETGLPIHFHTHSTSGVAEASLLNAIEASADIVDVATSSMSGLTSQPCFNSILEAIKSTEKRSSINIYWAQKISDYFEKVRRYYFPFESGLKSPTAEVYKHEIPGGQYSNLIVQIEATNLVDKWEEIKDMYKKVNDALGDIIKVTPSSKVVGDLALFLVKNNLTIEDLYKKGETLSFPDSVYNFFKGMLGQPYKGFPKKLQKIILKGEKPITDRPGKQLKEYDFQSAEKELKNIFNRNFTEEDIISYALYPAVFKDYIKFTDVFGDPSVFSTKSFFYPLKREEEIYVDIEEGKTLIIKYLGFSEIDKKGYRTVYFELNGQPRSVQIKDEKFAEIVKSNIKGNLDDPRDICATMPGKIAQILVKKGDTVHKGKPLVITEAMKMETKITSSLDGRVNNIYLSEGSDVESGDLIMRLE
ncbi:MAG: pyruvate carboxylase [Deferribacterota bacterium]|nr:pyruvate carboxylase [Deferribacterota bacterium]